MLLIVNITFGLFWLVVFPPMLILQLGGIVLWYAATSAARKAVADAVAEVSAPSASEKPPAVLPAPAPPRPMRDWRESPLVRELMRREALEAKKQSKTSAKKPAKE